MGYDVYTCKALTCFLRQNCAIILTVFERSMKIPVPYGVG